MVIRDSTGEVRTPAGVLARLLSAEGSPDPYPDYRLLRSFAPVYHHGNVTFVSGYADCQHILNDARFRVQDPQWYDATLPTWRDSTATRLMYHSVQSRNDDDHTRLRRALGGAFSPRRMAAYRLQIEQVVRILLDRMAEAGSDGGKVDVMTHLAYPLPTAVIGEMLGVPHADREHFRALAVDFFTVMDMYADPAVRRRQAVAGQAMLEYSTDLVAQRRRAPRRDLTTELTQACDGGLLSEDELMGILLFLFAAGYGTTAALLGNATQQLLEHADEAARLRENPARIDTVVEESLRHDTPTQFAPRLAGADCIVGGVEIPAGRLLVSLIGAANRDPFRFSDPDRFWPGRSPARGLSFGGGVHFCLGAALSRLEATVALPALLTRFPRLAAAGPPVRRRALRMRAHTSFPVSLSG